ncbi:MAG TPA: DoxX family protein [Gemmatimonadales bacterium]|nr:DoxX family protein [Gemmatimonadales bacterium]
MTRAARALIALRVGVATLLFIHGAYRIYDNGPPGFGDWLASQGLPFGLVIAWGVTIMEVVGTLVMASGRFVPYLALYFTTVLTAGIVLVHGKEGWFVVGGGRNGMEYSVLLILALLVTAYADRDLRASRTS